MGLELPAYIAIIARLSQPKVQLAAFGSVVFPVSLVIMAPIIMVMTASNALSKDWDSYRKLGRFMAVAATVLTGLHASIAFTPFYYVVVEGVIGAPAEIVEPARLGLMNMTPLIWSVAYRRFNQGVLIRFGHSRAVGMGTVIRFGTDALVLAVGMLVGTIPGTNVAASAWVVGCIAEAMYVGCG